jgi:PTS system nitrogen regulatory IIA component
MQLTVREVSKYLNVSEATVTRWIKQRGLPSQHVGGQFRFNPAELLEWATTNKIKVSVEMFDRADPEDEPVPSLVEALELGGIFYDLKDVSKDQALRALVDLLPLPEGIDREEIFRLFQARESLTTTAIGNGIALPHVRSPMVLHVERPMVTLCFLENPVDFGALDRIPVQVLFSIICPTTRSHLQILSRLSQALNDPAFRAAVLSQAQPDEILEAARRVEASLPSSAAPAGKAKP